MRYPFLLVLGLSASLGAAPKTLGYIRVTASTPIYHGADENSAVEATASKDDVYGLVDDKLIHGFYKIDYNDHVSYIQAGAVTSLGAPATAVPTPQPAPKPTVKAPADDDGEDSGSDDRHGQATGRDQGDDDRGRAGGGDQGDDEARPTPRVTPRPTAKAGQDDDDEDVDPTRVPTRWATPAPSPYPSRVVTLPATAVPTPPRGQDDDGGSRPTRVPTRWATPAPSPYPSRVVTLPASAVPTAQPDEDEDQVQPTALPTPVATPRGPGYRPTRWATPASSPQPSPAAPTPLPTRVLNTPPTPLPTAAPTVAPTPQPSPTPYTGVITPERARGRRRLPAPTPAPVYRSQTRQNQGAGWGTALQLGGSVANGVQMQREPGHLDRFELLLPLGMGKHQALVQPPFKQNPSVEDQRPIEFSGFIGLGMEFRPALPLRLHFDWLAHSHYTKAADLGIPALKVDVPGSPSTTLFDQSEAYYRMNAHQLRAGLKLSLPFSVVEPWVDGTYGAWIWSAELSDLHREIIYGEANGVEFGGTLGVGIDFHGSFAGGLGWTLTPFVEWGAPQVNPIFKDIASLGVDWRDNFGTPVAVPARAGLQFGIGF